MGFGVISPAEMLHERREYCVIVMSRPYYYRHWQRRRFVDRHILQKRQRRSRRCALKKAALTRMPRTEDCSPSMGIPACIGFREMPHAIRRGNFLRRAFRPGDLPICDAPIYRSRDARSRHFTRYFRFEQRLATSAQRQRARHRAATFSPISNDSFTPADGRRRFLARRARQQPSGRQ